MPLRLNQVSLSKQVAITAMMTVLAMAISYVERMIPFHLAVPGIKLGLANVVILISLYLFGTKIAFFVDLLRIFMISFLFTGVYGLIYSLSGGMLSFGMMVLLKKCHRFGIIGVSVGGSVLHNTGQILAAMLLMTTTSLIYYLPVLIITGTVTGLLIGLFAGLLLKKLSPAMHYFTNEAAKK